MYDQFMVFDDCPTILCAGTFEMRKGQIDLVLANLYLQMHTRIKYRIIFLGNQVREYSSAIKRFINSLPYDFSKYYIFVPKDFSIEKYYAMADIFFCGSREESYPRTILEAMAASLGIITTPVSGIPEQVEDEDTCLFYSPGDIEKLVKCLIRMHDPDLRKRLGKNARMKIETMQSYSEMIDKYADEIRRCANLDLSVPYEAYKNYAMK